MSTYKYLAEKNPKERTLPGVPLRDLTADDLAGWPEHIRRYIADCDFYEPVEGKPAKRGKSK